jgi:integrase
VANKVVRLIKDQAMSKYAQDWMNFLLFLAQWYKEAQTFRKETERNFQMTQMLIQEQTSLTIATLTQEIQQKNQTIEDLQQKMKTIGEELNGIKEFTDSLLLKQKIKDENKLKKQARNKKPARDKRDLDNLEKLYDFILEKLKQGKLEEFSTARIIVAFTILYFTALRVSNLLLITKGNIQAFIINGEMDLPVIKKNKNVVQTFYLPKSAKEKMDFIAPYLKILLEGKENGDLLFTTTKKKPIHQKTFIAELNTIMKGFGAYIGKNLTTHSFRINMATEITE